jgi:hypothetical protein
LISGTGLFAPIAEAAKVKDASANISATETRSNLINILILPIAMLGDRGTMP